MTCIHARELLPELAVGVLGPREREEVEWHIRWCAGCRKEAGELAGAAATLAFALEPATPPDALRERVVEQVRRVAGAPAGGRRVRTAVASMMAAMVAVASLGWGAVMAGRADRFEDRARVAEEQRTLALERFQRILVNVVPDQELPTNETHLGQLSPTSEGQGGGAVLQLVSPRMIDFSIVIVNGLDPAASDRLPYRVRLLNGDGDVLRAGTIGRLDANGGGEVFRQFETEDLTGFTTVRVLDATGEVVLAGTIDQNA